MGQEPGKQKEHPGAGEEVTDSVSASAQEASHKATSYKTIVASQPAHKPTRISHNQLKLKTYGKENSEECNSA